MFSNRKFPFLPSLHMTDVRRYGPHKFAKILHSAFVQLTGPMLEYEINGHAEVKSPPIESPDSSTPTQTPIPLPPSTETPNPIPEMPKETETPAIPKPNATPADQPKENIPPPVSSNSPTKPKDLRVLLVEDNEINLKLLIATMRKLKITHSTASNGLEALNAYKDCRGDFDVIFMDISMPVMSGIDSTRHIRRFEREEGLEPTRLIALTGAANPNTRQEAFSSGVDLFLTKPVPMRELRGMLEDIRREAERILEETRDV